MVLGIIVAQPVLPGASPPPWSALVLAIGGIAGGLELAVRAPSPPRRGRKRFLRFGRSPLARG